ncbi:hypothetical protein [Acetobacter oeni]|uniref:Uncharacterized protein n=1 Tax=Acetobacter oeni TaxID=304077 RepID=A0A511XHC4_9PROT|nr:hypothetical protein [Acetobacter oeni]MBB3882475.1 hypothetical protein [Acetobacter oeni]NHO18432.1 hypothetical protein [Acetobacter oeni]GBR03241.1 hypothetical protein AA21952_0995 [Acetobacter oeni LMG 21952]GEN62329.1 hypothetical protein AOE01nite_05530 [Acetobacter oeni]
MLKPHHLVATAVLCTLLSATHPAGATTPTPPILFGTAGTPCETFSRQFAEARAETPAQATTAMADYVTIIQGMLSEYNMRAFVEDRPDQAGTHLSNSAFLSHVNDFCQKNPDLQFAIGAQDLITSLRGTQVTPEAK